MIFAIFRDSELKKSYNVFCFIINLIIDKINIISTLQSCKIKKKRKIGFQFHSIK